MNISVYNIYGERVKTLADNTVTPGYYSIKISRDNLSDGIYFCRLEADNSVIVKKISIQSMK